MIKIRQIRSIAKFFIPDKLFYRYLIPLYKFITKTSQKKRKLLRFQVNVADHCNLNCKGCTAFSPIAESKFIDIDSYERDCKRLSDLTGGKIELIDLLGGEPLLHPDISKILEISRMYFKAGDINIITNGILLNNMPQEFWYCCSTNKISIIISGYPVRLDMESLKKKAQDNNIMLTIRGNTNNKKIWNKVPVDIEGRQNIAKNFRLCFGANFCITLDNGRLATCPIPFVIVHFNAFFGKDILVKENDSIDIYKANTIDEILEFLCKPAPICAYCNLNKIQYGIDWSLSQKEISEWI